MLHTAHPPTDAVPTPAHEDKKPTASLPLLVAQIEQIAHEAEQTAHEAALAALTAFAVRIFVHSENVARNLDKTQEAAERAEYLDWIWRTEGDQAAHQARLFADWTIADARRTRRWAGKFTRLLAAYQQAGLVAGRTERSK